MALLEVDTIHTYYGKIHALRGISLTVEQGEIVTLIGGNGAGKTTTLKTICGITPAAEGKIHLNGEDITRMRPHEIVARGVIQSPEGRRIFKRMSVQENLIMGAYTRNDQTGIDQDLEFVFTTFPRLKERIAQAGGTLQIDAELVIVKNKFGSLGTIPMQYDQTISTWLERTTH